VRRTAVEALARRETAAVIAAALSALRDDHRDFNVLSSTMDLLAGSEIDVVEPLLDLLDHEDPDLRLQAALALGERGDARAVPALIKAAATGDENLRFHAIEALGKLRALAAVDILVETASSGNFFLAFPALEALAEVGDPGVAPRLAPLMADELLRGAVATTLGRIGDEDVVVPLTRLLNAATAPSEVVADALARVYDRYEERYRNGEHIAGLVRRSITATGTQNLLDAVSGAAEDHLRSVAKVLGWLEGPAVDRALTRLLGQPAVRSKVVEYLVRHGEGVVDLLLEQLGSEDLEVRQAAVVGLGRIGDRRATPALVEALSSDPELTLVIAGALARIGDPRAFEALLSLVGHPDAAFRQAAIAALNSIGHPEMAGRVSVLLRDLRSNVRESAVRIAGYFGYPECADDLVRCCYDPHQAVRRAAIEHLPFLDDARAVPILIASLHNPDPLMRNAAAQALAHVDDERAVDPLLAAIADTDSWVRYFAARALGDQRRQRAVEALTRLAVEDPAGHVRLAATMALGSIGSPQAVPVLAEIAGSGDSERANAAVRALGHIPHAEAWSPLEAVLRSEDQEMRAAAALAIARLGGSKAVELLEWTAAADRSERVLETALRGLVELAADATVGVEAVRALVALTSDGERRDQVVAALASLPPSSIDELADRGLRDARPSVRVATLQAFGRMRRRESSRWLQHALADPQPEVRLASLIELRHLGTNDVDRNLVLLARSDPDAAVRRAALATLRRSSDPASDGVDDADADASAIASRELT
jgi:HEAT repeat protein